MPIKNWSTNANANNSSPPNGFPENMAPNQLNNTNRQNMADIRSWYEDAQWIDLGDTPAFVSTTSFTIAGDVTAQYQVNRRVKLTDASTLYGTITASSYSSPNTTITITLDSGVLSSSLSAVAIGILSGSSNAIPANLGIINLTLPGILTVSGAAVFSTTADIKGALTAESTATISGAGVFSTTLDVKGALTAESTATISGAAVMSTTLDVKGALTAESTATISGAAVFSTTLDVKGALTAESTATISGQAVCTTGLSVGGITTLSGAANLLTTLSVGGATTLSGAANLLTTLNVSGATTLSGAVNLVTTLNVSGATTLSGAVNLNTTLNVLGASTLSGAAVLKSTLNVTGNTTLQGTTSLSGAAVCNTTLNVLGATTLSGAVNLTTTLNVTGTTTLSGGAVINGAFQVNGATTISGAATFKSTVSISGAVTMGTPLGIASGGTGINFVDPNADRILFWDDSAGNFAGLAVSTGLTISGTSLIAQPRGLFRAYDSTSLTSITNNSSTKVTCDAEDVDLEGWYDNATNFRYTPQVAGWYFFCGCVSFNTTTASYNVFSIIRLNGTTSALKATTNTTVANRDMVPFVCGLVHCNGSTDFIELFAFQDTGSSQTVAGSPASSVNWFGGWLVAAD